MGHRSICQKGHWLAHWIIKLKSSVYQNVIEKLKKGNHRIYWHLYQAKKSTLRGNRKCSFKYKEKGGPPDKEGTDLEVHVSDRIFMWPDMNKVALCFTSYEGVANQNHSEHYYIPQSLNKRSDDFLCWGRQEATRTPTILVAQFPWETAAVCWIDTFYHPLLPPLWKQLT